MSNFKRNSTLQALNIGVNGRVPLIHTESIDAIIGDDVNAKVAIMGGLDADGIVRALKLNTSGQMELGAVTISDLKVGSTDGTTADTYLRTDADGRIELSADINVNEIQTGTTDGVNGDTFLKTDANGRLEVIPIGSLSVSETVANNEFGLQPGIAPGVTVALAEILSTPAGYKFRGFNCTGTGDGYFSVSIDSTIWYSGRINNTTRTVSMILPNPHLIPEGSDIALDVTNEALDSADFEGTLLGE